MPVRNADIAEQFDLVADLLEIQGANTFRVRAYRAAARSLRDLPYAVASMVESGQDLSELPGVGKDLADKIVEIVETGKLTQIEELQQEIPEGLVAVLAVAGLGPKRVKKLHETLGVVDLETLEAAAREGRIAGLAGFGEKTQERVLRELETRGSGERRVKRREAETVAEPLIEYLRQVSGVDKAIIAGSYRRKKETVGDLDILVTCAKDSPVIERFVAYDDVRDVLSHGQTRSTVVLKNGLQVDLRVLEKACYGAALHYFTGSKDHSIRVRKRAIERGLKINEYGVFRGDDRVVCESEEEVYAQVGLPCFPPEIREDRGEIEAAENGTLPTLIELTNIKGNLHSHTKASDGAGTLRGMAEAAKAAGWEYLAITDHSKAVRIASGLDENRLARQIEEIDALNEELDGITLLKAIEVDILEDGTLDLSDEILARLDLRVCAIHSRFQLPREKQTERVLRAMDNTYFNILAHPTGRLIEAREGYQIDMERIIAHAKQSGCVLEVNAQPDRLDLNDVHCRMAKDAGVRLSIATDAHAPTQLHFMRYGVEQARRGWIAADDVVNTRPLDALKRLITR